jgi:glycosyltransferase involved in cell wall biosynthesis
VRFIGWRDDVPALLATSDLLVCPSRHEPLGNVIIEGWAHGCPVVASSAAGPRWLIHHGQDGLLVPIDDAPALAVALRRVIEDKALGPALAAAGRARIETEFSEAVVVARYREFFDRVAR